MLCGVHVYVHAYIEVAIILYARWHFAAARAEILQNDTAIVETVQRHLGQNAVSRSAFNCDEIYVDQIADANNGENLLSR